MFVSDCLQVNQAGHLTIGGVDAVELAANYGTPLYVMYEGLIRANCRKFTQSMQKYYGGHGRVVYASKAFCCKRMCQIAAEEGLGLDVVSGGELYTALAAGVDPSLLYFHGNNKTDAELMQAVEAGVGTVVVDNLAELERLDAIAGAAGRTVPILLRIKPGIEAHTHSFVQTGQNDSKFGFALETGEALAAVREAEAAAHVRLDGIHCHIGSQIFDLAPFELAPEVMMGFLHTIKNTIGRELPVMNLGGGFGIRYTETHDPCPYERFMERVSAAVHACCERYGMEQPFVAIEPGRSIVGASGVTLYTVGSIKEIPHIRTYVSVDGGMTDNPRYILYQSEYAALIANRAAAPKTLSVTIAGRCCESGDLLGEGVPLQQPREGDILAVCATGAYNYSMASNYNRVPRPPVVMVRDGKPYLAVRRETYEDLLACDLDAEG